jgi:hypothetical protein
MLARALLCGPFVVAPPIVAEIAGSGLVAIDAGPEVLPKVDADAAVPNVPLSTAPPLVVAGPFTFVPVLTNDPPFRIGTPVPLPTAPPMRKPPPGFVEFVQTSYPCEHCVQQSV